MFQMPRNRLITVLEFVLVVVTLIARGVALGDWKTELEKTVLAAKKEGQLTVYSSFATGPWAKPFAKQYPEIKYVLVNNTPAQLGQRIMAEKRAGKMLADVAISGANPNYQIFHAAKILDSVKAALILPEVLDLARWWQGKHWYVDPEEEYVFVYLGNVARVDNFNTNLLKAEQFKSYWDFLNPNWKSRMVARDIRTPGSGGDAARFLFHSPELGPNFLRRLFSEMEITLSGDSRQGIDWMAQGKFPLGLFLGEIDLGAAQGLPVDEFDPHHFKEGAPLGVGNGVVSLLSNAPHPNAARVFINWFLSREGQAELDTRLGGGIVFNQVPHQVDMVRWIGGGLVRSVRSMTGIWDPSRPTEGSHTTYLEFVDGAAATLVYNAYDHFDSDQFNEWTGEGGERKRSDRHGEARRLLKEAKSSQEEVAMKASTGYGGRQQRRAAFSPGEGERYHPHFGVTVISCERGDLRPAPNGVVIYDDNGKRDVPLPLGRAIPDKGKVIDELYDAVINDRAVYHNGRWGKATLEVCLAIMKSARERQEVFLAHQVDVGD
jgi:ABC-type Fe3+ transport system substrate-binding protein